MFRPANIFVRSPICWIRFGQIRTLFSAKPGSLGASAAQREGKISIGDAAKTLGWGLMLRVCSHRVMEKSLSSVGILPHNKSDFTPCQWHYVIHYYCYTLPAVRPQSATFGTFPLFFNPMHRDNKD